jgi:hypothetical protein
MPRRSHGDRSPLTANPLFGPLPLELSENLRSLNPWWRGQPGPPLPRFRRWPFARLLRLLRSGIAPGTALRGPRRVGKTVLLRQILEDLLGSGVQARRLLYVPFDDLPTFRGIQEPVLAVARWFEEQVLGHTFNAAARAEEPAYILLDEVQNLEQWAPQVKSLVDNHAVRVLLTGSSSLRIEVGQDSLAGRLSTLDIGPLLLREIAALRLGEEQPPFWPDNGLDALARPEFWRDGATRAQADERTRRQAFSAYSKWGAYPAAHDQTERSWPELADYLNETVIRRVIRHDLRLGERGRKRDERLLEHVFRLCCRYAGQSPGPSVFVPEIATALAANVGWARIASYQRFLDGSRLLRLVEPLEIRLKRRKAPAKICLCDPALRASWLQEVVPLDPEGLAESPHLSDLAGHLAESCLGYLLASVPGLDVAYFPERGSEPEVDFVLTVGSVRIPVEVKYRKRIDPFDDTRGLRTFLEKAVYNAPFGLLVTLEDGVQVPDPRIVPISLSALLWMR